MLFVQGLSTHHNVDSGHQRFPAAECSVPSQPGDHLEHCVVGASRARHFYINSSLRGEALETNEQEITRTK